MTETIDGYADVNPTGQEKDGLPPGRIVMSLQVKEAHPIGDIARFLLNTEAKRLHPDVGGNPEAFKELQEAYEAVKAR